MSDNSNKDAIFDLQADTLLRGTERFSRILATEGLTIEHDENLLTAEFDVVERVIRLPIMEGMTPEVYEGYLSHEVGHALYSPGGPELKKIGMDLEKKGVPFYYLNVTEDARIEKLLKRRYPGMVRSFGLHYRTLREDLNVFRHPLGLPLDQWDLVDRINYRMKMGETVPVPFTAEEYKFVDALLSEDCETVEDAARIAEEIFQFAQSRGTASGDMKFGEGESRPGTKASKKDSANSKKSPNQNGQGDSASDDQGDGENDHGESASDDQGGGENGQGSGKGKSDNQSKDSSNSADGSGSESDEENGDDGDASGPGNSKDAGNFSPKDRLDKTTGWSDKAVHDGLKKKSPRANGAGGGIRYDQGVSNVVFAPKLSWTNWIVSGKDKVLSSKASVSKEFSDFEADTAATVSLMAQIFQQKASARNYARTAVAKTGHLDLRLISKYKFTDDLFKKIAVTPKQKNHGYVMIIDWSSSMSSVAENTILQASLMVRFWERIQAPFDVYLFTDGGYYVHTPKEHTTGLIPSGDFHMIHVSSSTWKSKENKQVLSWAMGTAARNIMNYTPLEESLVCARYILDDFISANRLDKTTMILVTDGDGNGPPAYMQKEKRVNIIPNKAGFIFDQKTGVNIRVPQALAERMDGRRFLVALKSIFGPQLTIVGFFIGGSMVSNALSDRMAVKIKDIQYDTSGMTRWTVKGIGYDKFFVVNAKAFSRGSSTPSSTKESDVPPTSEGRIVAIAKAAAERPSQKLSVMAKEFVATTA